MCAHLGKDYQWIHEAQVQLHIHFAPYKLTRISLYLTDPHILTLVPKPPHHLHY